MPIRKPVSTPAHTHSPMPASETPDQHLENTKTGGRTISPVSLGENQVSGREDDSLTRVKSKSLDEYKITKREKLKLFINEVKQYANHGASVGGFAGLSGLMFYGIGVTVTVPIGLGLGAAVGAGVGCIAGGIKALLTKRNTPVEVAAARLAEAKTNKEKLESDIEKVMSHKEKLISALSQQGLEVENKEACQHLLKQKKEQEKNMQASLADSKAGLGRLAELDIAKGQEASDLYTEELKYQAKETAEHIMFRNPDIFIGTPEGHKKEEKHFREKKEHYHRLFLEAKTKQEASSTPVQKKEAEQLTIKIKRTNTDLASLCESVCVLESLLQSYVHEEQLRQALVSTEQEITHHENNIQSLSKQNPSKRLQASEKETIARSARVIQPKLVFNTDACLETLQEDADQKAADLDRKMASFNKKWLSHAQTFQLNRKNISTISRHIHSQESPDDGRLSKLTKNVSSIQVQLKKLTDSREKLENINEGLTYTEKAQAERVFSKLKDAISEKEKQLHALNTERELMMLADPDQNDQQALQKDIASLVAIWNSEQQIQSEIATLSAFHAMPSLKDSSDIFRKNLFLRAVSWPLRASTRD